MIKLKNLLNEYTENSFQMDKIEPKKRLEKTAVAKMMPKTTPTIQEAEKKISDWVGERIFFHSQFFIVKPKGNKPDTSTYWIGLTEYYTNDEKINVSKISVADVTGQEPNTPVKNILAEAYVSTDVALGEIRSAFEVIRKGS